MILKRFTFLFVAFVCLSGMAWQSCGLTGNNTTTGGHPPGLVQTAKGYLTEVQSDSNFRMVSLTKYLQPLFNDLRYGTKQNFTGKVLYHDPVAYLRLPVARALQAVQQELQSRHLAIKIWDAYRPYAVTVEMWKVVPDERYAANPAKGSGHNRGAAVDLTLVDLTTGKELPMPTGFDDFTEKAHHNYMNLPAAVLANRQLLRDVMERNGFVALETEWWHYSLANAKQFSLLDLDFAVLDRLSRDQ